MPKLLNLSYIIIDSVINIFFITADYLKNKISTSTLYIHNKHTQNSLLSFIRHMKLVCFITTLTFLCPIKLSQCCVGHFVFCIFMWGWGSLDDLSSSQSRWFFLLILKKLNLPLACFCFCRMYVIFITSLSQLTIKSNSIPIFQNKHVLFSRHQIKRWLVLQILEG